MYVHSTVCRPYDGGVSSPRERLHSAASYLVALGALGAITGACVAGPAYWTAQQVEGVTGAWESIEVDMSVFETPLAQHTEIVDATGAPLATLYSENRTQLLSLDEVSPTLVDAVLAVEDREFYTHGPIDVVGTARALARNTLSGTEQGGSTITQQYVKLMRATSGQDAGAKAEASEASLDRKIVELRYAVELEKVATKDDILLGYLNAAYFGDGAYGVGEAASHYFGVNAADLDVPQSAMLAGLLRNPVGYNPITEPETALARRNLALGSMTATGAITAQEAEAAKATDVGATQHPRERGCATSPYPYYCDWVVSELLTDPAFGESEAVRERNLYTGGFTVRTALDPAAMAQAQGSVDAALGRQDVAAAVAVVEPGTGYVKAIAQTRDYDQTQFNIPVQAQLQIGSTFKPITLAAAIARGFSPTGNLTAPHPYTPASGNSPSGGFRNLDGISRGPIDARTALKYSVNTWFVRLAEQTGVTDVADTAYALGMSSMNPSTRTVGPADLSITLGAFETTVVDTANVYATLAASGVRCDPTPIVSVATTQGGTERPAPATNCHQAISAAVADTVTADLRVTGEEGGTAAAVEVTGHDWAGKTGTSNANGATWFAGYTRQLATAVWVGDPRGPSHSANGAVAYGVRHPVVYGSTIAAPIFNDAMNRLNAGVPNIAFNAPGPITPSGTALPDVRGLELPAALGSLKLAGALVEVVEVDAAGATPGTVLTQTPDPGSSLGIKVRLDVAAAPEHVDNQSGERR